MEESTALWLLGLAHSEYEAVRSELDLADGWHKATERDLDAARKEADALRVERMTLRDERDAARAEAETLRAERDALKSAARGWFRIGEWAFVTLDGRIVRNTNGEWAAEDADHLCYGSTAIEAARAAGWHDFPGASDHSAGDP